MNKRIHFGALVAVACVSFAHAGVEADVKAMDFNAKSLDDIQTKVNAFVATLDLEKDVVATQSALNELSGKVVTRAQALGLKLNGSAVQPAFKQTCDAHKSRYQTHKVLADKITAFEATMASIDKTLKAIETNAFNIKAENATSEAYKIAQESKDSKVTEFRTDMYTVLNPTNSDDNSEARTKATTSAKSLPKELNIVKNDALEVINALEEEEKANG